MAENRRISDDESNEGWKLRRPVSETVVHFKLWAILLVFLTIFYSFYNTINIHSERIASLETTQKFVLSSVEELKTIARENNTLLLRQIEHNNGGRK